MANNVYSNYQEANTMDKGNGYKLAALDNRDGLLRDISKYENEMRRKIGQDVVLNAYTKESDR